MSQQATGFFREQNMLVRKHLEKQIKELKKKYADVVEKNKKLYKRNRLIADYCKTLEKERDTIITGYDDILDTYKKENNFGALHLRVSKMLEITYLDKIYFCSILDFMNVHIFGTQRASYGRGLVAKPLDFFG